MFLALIAPNMSSTTLVLVVTTNPLPTPVSVVSLVKTVQPTILVLLVPIFPVRLAMELRRRTLRTAQLVQVLHFTTAVEESFVWEILAVETLQ